MVDNKRVALVTGASRGIGKEISKQLSADGFRIAVNYNSSAGEAEQLVAELGGEPRAIAVQADVRKPDSVRNMLDLIQDRLGTVSVLVNNAGIVRPAKLTQMSIEDWDSVIGTTLYGAFHCAKYVVGDMPEHGGRIINISSTYGLSGSYGQVNYSAAKAGMIGFTKALALETANNKITVNAVAPGLIETEMAALIPDKIRDRIIDQTPIHRLGTPQEVASLVSYLVMPEAGYITGQVFAVNGGLYM